MSEDGDLRSGGTGSEKLSMMMAKLDASMINLLFCRRRMGRESSFGRHGKLVEERRGDGWL